MEHKYTFLLDKREIGVVLTDEPLGGNDIELLKISFANLKMAAHYRVDVKYCYAG